MSEKPLVSFDYAIQYLLKNRGDHEIVEGFLSALLTTEGYPPVKIKALLESNRNEINWKLIFLKNRVADLIVEDESRQNYIVEIEREYTNRFIHKDFFNSSRIIMDSFSDPENYTNIKKIFRISLLYFNWDNMNNPLDHGKAILRETDSEHPRDFCLANLGGKFFDLTNVLPEYFLISVPSFDDIIRGEIDEWLYVMKHSDVKEDFKSPYMKKVRERLSLLKMTEKERIDYYTYEGNLHLARCRQYCF